MTGLLLADCQKRHETDNHLLQLRRDPSNMIRVEELVAWPVLEFMTISCSSRLGMSCTTCQTVLLGPLSNMQNTTANNLRMFNEACLMFHIVPRKTIQTDACPCARRGLIMIYVWTSQYRVGSRIATESYAMACTVVRLLLAECLRHHRHYISPLQHFIC